LIFGHTFETNEGLIGALSEEKDGQRDIAIYIGDPHVLLSMAPQELFLDPSHTYRIYLEQYRPPAARTVPYMVRRLQSLADAEGMNRIYARRQMVATDPHFVWSHRKSRELTFLVAEDLSSGEIIG